MALNINGTTGISGVDGSVSAPAVTGTDSNTGITFPSADTIKFATGGVERMSITNSGFSGIIQGIQEFDSYYLSANKTADGIVDANWLRNNRAGAASQIGTGMSVSSGVFTFPSTGKYLVITVALFSLSGTDNIALDTQVTTDNSGYATHARAQDGSKGSGSITGSGTSFSFVDVTDTSQVKVRFDLTSVGTNSYLAGNANFLTTHLTFIRVGDT